MKPRNREEDTGRYDYDFSRMCVCGHPYGDHAAGKPHPCFGEDCGGGCDCQKFKPAR